MPRAWYLRRLGAGDDPTLLWQLVEPVVGPYNLPPQAFDESHHQHVLGSEVPAATPA